MHRASKASRPSRRAAAGPVDTAGLLTVSQLRDYLGISRTSLYWMRVRGELPPSIRIMRRKLFWQRSTIDAWLARRAEQSLGRQRHK